MTNFRHVAPVAFPTFGARSVNMMPFVMGDHSSIPADLHDYIPLIDACPVGEEKGRIGYLTIDERFVADGSHRRPGVHTEGFGAVSWGGTNWGGSGGLYIANSVDDSCVLYDAHVGETPFGGAVQDEQLAGVPSLLMPADNLYWLHDRTPHASLPIENRERQFFRLVTSNVTLWFALHSTANPLGVQPAARIVTQDKFAYGAAA